MYTGSIVLFMCLVSILAIVLVLNAQNSFVRVSVEAYRKRRLEAWQRRNSLIYGEIQDAAMNEFRHYSNNPERQVVCYVQSLLAGEAFERGHRGDIYQLPPDVICQAYIKAVRCVYRNN